MSPTDDPDDATRQPWPTWRYAYALVLYVAASTAFMSVVLGAPLGQGAFVGIALWVQVAWRMRRRRPAR